MKRIPKSRLFFLELMINIFFFCVCSAICLAVFASAYSINSQSTLLSRAVMRAQTAAECYRASKGDINQTASVLGAEKPIDSELYLCYNSQNEVTAIDKAEIIVKILPDEETEYFSSAFITVYSAKDKSEIYELHASALKKGAE